MKLLVVESEQASRISIKNYLMEEGNICESCPDLQTALYKTNHYNYDCIILNLHLTDGYGLDLLHHLKRQRKEDGVVIISSENSLSDRVKGLDLGADDYLIKPFHLAELKARILAVHRRKGFNGNNLLNFDNIVIDLNAMDVRAAGKTVVLTKNEYNMLTYFIANSGKVLTRKELAAYVWHDNIDHTENMEVIYTNIKNLRRKLMACTGKDFFKSIYGIGYRFA